MTTFAATKGVFATRSDIALQSIAGLGFRPLAVIAWWSRQASHRIERGNGGGIGFWTRDASTAVAWMSGDGKTSTDTGSLADTAAILGLDGVGGGVGMRAELASFDTDGMTLRWTVRPSAQWMVHFLALGGAPFMRARVGCVSSPPSAASTDLELEAIRADLLLLVPAPAETGVRAEGLSIGIGAANGRHQAAAGYACPHGAPPGSVTGAQRSDSAVIVVSSPGDPPMIGAVRLRGAQGLAVEWSGTGQPAQRLCYLAVEGLRAEVGMDVSTATPERRRTRVGFRPKALLVFSWGLAASAQPKTMGRLCIGGASERETGCVSWDDRDIEAHETSTHVASSTRHALVITDSQTGGVHARAVLDSIDDKGFTLDWIEADGKLRQFAYVALGHREIGSPVGRVVNRIFRGARSDTLS